MPTTDELRFDSRARMEARAKVKGLPESHLVELIQVQREESRTSNERQRKGWEEDWRLYQSEVDFSDKEDWQSQVWIPMPFSATEQATAIIQRSLLDSSEFFGIDGVEERDKALAEHIWKPLIGLQFNKAGFVHKFADAVKVSYATGISLYLKFRWRSVPYPILAGMEMDPTTGSLVPVFQTKRRGGLTIECVPPWQVYRDPKSRPREQWSGSYLIHEEYIDRAFLTAGQEAGYYRNAENVKEGSAGSTGHTDTGPDVEAKRRQQEWHPHKFRKPILASEWYGDILNEHGDIVYPDAVMTAAGGQLIYGPADNPLWAVDHKSGRRKWPMIAFSPLSHALRFEGFGILKAVAPIAVLFSNLFNLFADGLNWAVNPATEVDIDILDDWDDLEDFPGKLWAKRGQGKALQTADRGRMDSSTVLAAMQFIQQLWQNESFVTSFVAGLPGTRSNITKGEVQIKTQQSMGIFEGMGRNVEAGGTAAVELAFDFLSQYGVNSPDAEILQVLGPKAAPFVRLLAMMDPIQRMQELSGNFNYTFTGVSAALMKADMLGRLMQFAQVAAQELYAGRTNPSEILTAIADTMGLRDRITVSEEQMVPVSQVQKAMAQMEKAGMIRAIPGGTASSPRALPNRAPTMRELAPTSGELAATGTE